MKFDLTAFLVAVAGVVAGLFVYDQFFRKA